jgi:tripartite ATP-independent transporter DctP family solute receptor
MAIAPAANTSPSSTGRLSIRGFDAAPRASTRAANVDGAIITNAVIAQVETAFQINDLPFLYANEKQAQKVLDGEVGAILANKLSKKGVLALGFMEGGYRQMINNKQPVQTPDDVKGVKYRVMQNPTFIDMFNSLGGAAVPMAWGETFTAVQQGTVDGLEIPLAVIDANKYYEVTKFLSLTNHTYSMIGLVVSKRWFDKLPKDLQKAVVEAGKMATAEQRKTVGQNTQSIIDSLKAKGMQVNQVSNPAAFRAAVQPMYQKASDKVGSDLMQTTLNAVK